MWLATVLYLPRNVKTVKFNTFLCFQLLQQRLARDVLTTLKEHPPQTWTRVDTIFEFSSNQETKYNYALQILEAVIKTRWKTLPREQCEGIKKYIVGLIIKKSSENETAEGEVFIPERFTSVNLEGFYSI